MKELILVLDFGGQYKELIARADEHLNNGIRDKIALFCNVKPDCVIENITLSSLYEAPLMLHRNGYNLWG